MQQYNYYKPAPNVDATEKQRGLMTAAMVKKLAGLQRPMLRLSYDAAVDLVGGVANAAGNFLDVTSNQAFTVSSLNSVVYIEVRCGVAATSALLGGVGTHLLINNSSRVRLDADQIAAGGWGLAGGATFMGSAFPAGTNNIRLQVYTRNAATVYCRPATEAETEFVSFRIWELAQ